MLVNVFVFAFVVCISHSVGAADPRTAVGVYAGSSSWSVCASPAGAVGNLKWHRHFH